MSVGEWYLSTDGEYFTVGGYSTREKAIERAPVELDLAPGDEFWTGRAVPAQHAISARNVLDMLEEYDESNRPDGCDGFDVSPEASAELDALLEAWASKHGVAPAWWSIEDDEQHEAPEVKP